jgi:hypothetical protein
MEKSAKKTQTELLIDKLEVMRIKKSKELQEIVNLIIKLKNK